MALWFAVYQVDGQPLGEKNTKWLQDDYVKFIRFAQWRIQESGAGVLAFITNHGYLDNPTFRGMRQQLMQTFTHIYVLDLHGNTKRKERCPDGSPDENVFDIQQGAAIGIFVKEAGRVGPARVHHADLWGERGHKYAWLAEHDVATTRWAKLVPASPFYLFAPYQADWSDEYQRLGSIGDMMPVHSMAMNTHRDSLVVAFHVGELNDRVRELRSTEVPDSRFTDFFRQEV